MWEDEDEKLLNTKMNIVVRTDKAINEELSPQNEDKIGHTASLVAQVVMEAYIKAKNSGNETILLETEQWEENAWPKICLKLPSQQGSKDLLALAK